MASNEAAWLDQANAPLVVREAPMPVAGPNEIIVANAAVAINPLDTHMQSSGVFVQKFPAILGCDVAGVVHEVGAGAGARFRKGDRVIGHPINLVTSNPAEGAFARYTVVRADKAAILPDHIPFSEGVVLPFAVEAAACALHVKQPGEALPGVATPALGLPYPSSSSSPAPATNTSTNKALVVFGGSSSVGAVTTQLAVAAGLRVISICASRNFDLSRRCGAAEVFDRASPSLVDDVVAAVGRSGLEFAGIFDAYSADETYARDLEILARLGGGQLACTHPPPRDVPDNVRAGMIFAVNDVAAAVFAQWVTPALESGALQCLPAPRVVGKGLHRVQQALDLYRAGADAGAAPAKLVVEI